MQFPLLQKENNFLKIEINITQKKVGKLSQLNWLQSTLKGRTKIMVAGDSLVKYLRREELSSKKNNAKVMIHKKSTTEDIIDYIKLK